MSRIGASMFTLNNLPQKWEQNNMVPTIRIVRSSLDHFPYYYKASACSRIPVWTTGSRREADDQAFFSLRRPSNGGSCSVWHAAFHLQMGTPVTTHSDRADAPTAACSSEQPIALAKLSKCQAILLDKARHIPRTKDHKTPQEWTLRRIFQPIE